ncbi:MAG: hypothetical protein JWL58_3222 [Streptosporangiaceae bacterium]|nr:hypothetical protein [Streptosporangiaceae bacterium]
MEYQTEIRRVVEANIEEVRGDLDQARHALQRTQLEVGRLGRTVASLEALLELAGGHGSSEVESQSLTLHRAMVAVLTSAPGGMMRAGDLAAEIGRRGLYKMRDGRPVEAQQIHARVGQYPHLFVKEGTFITLYDQAV